MPMFTLEKQCSSLAKLLHLFAAHSPLDKDTQIHHFRGGGGPAPLHNIFFFHFNVVVGLSTLYTVSLF